MNFFLHPLQTHFSHDEISSIRQTEQLYKTESAEAIVATIKENM